jgi:type VI secretion system protein ImpK
LFQYICRLNRVARKSGAPASGDTTTFTLKAASVPRGVSLDYAVVRSEVAALFEDMEQKAAKDFRLDSQFKKMKLPLKFFVDSLISESSLPFAAQWNQDRLAYKDNELAGDERFFELLEDDKKDPSEEASERLAVFYVCIGLGFSGIYFQQPEFLKNTMFTIAPRIKRLIDADEMARICPDAYEGVDARDLTEPPSRKVLVISLIFLCLIVAGIVSYILLYRNYSERVNKSLTEIATHEQAFQQK